MGLISNMDWKNIASYVEVEPNCVFEGYKDANFGTLLGRWRGSIDAPNKHEMDLKYENDKMESFKCTCKEQTCAEHYTYGNDWTPHGGCPMPQCGVVSYDICDSWKKKVISIFFIWPNLRSEPNIQVQIIDQKYWLRPKRSK